MIAATTVETLSASRDLGRHMKMIHQLCYKFQQKNGGDPDDILEEAQLAYVEARNNFNPKKGTKFITYLHKIVRCRLLQLKRLNGRRREEERDYQEHPIAERVSLLDVIERECSPEANRVMELALNPPLDVVFLARTIRNEKRPKTLRQAIRLHLEELGWTLGQVFRAFSEIQEALG